MTHVGEVADEIVGGGSEKRQTACSICGTPMVQHRFLFGRKTPDAWPLPRCDGCIDRAMDAESARLRYDTVHRLLAELKTPPRYAQINEEPFVRHGTDAEQLEQGRMLGRVKAYIETWPRVPAAIVLLGPPGTGKGHIAWAITLAVVERYAVKARVVKLPDLVRLLRATWGRAEADVVSERVELDTYRRLDLLVIDEVSRHAFYGEPMRHLYDLIDHRLEWLRPTILTTNETPQGLTEILGPALTSRVGGESGLWGFQWSDYRLWKKDQTLSASSSG